MRWLVLLILVIPSVYAECYHDNFIDRVVSNCKDSSNDICDDGENFLLDQDCRLKGNWIGTMWFMRLMVIIALLLYINKSQHFFPLAIMVFLLAVYNGAIPYEPAEEKVIPEYNCTGVDYAKNVGTCIWPSRPMFGWVIVTGVVLYILHKLFRRRRILWY